MPLPGIDSLEVRVGQTVPNQMQFECFHTSPKILCRFLMVFLIYNLFFCFIIYNVLLPLWGQTIRLPRGDGV